MNKKKIILITGVSSGIGNAFVKEALKNPKIIVVGLGRINDKSIDNLNYVFYKVDLKNPTSINNAFNKIMRLYGWVDVLINNAGIGYRGTIEDMTVEEIRDQFEVNFFGLITLIKLVLPVMRKQKQGQIINLSSVASTVSTPTLGFYSATKSAVDKISDVLAQEVASYNIKVNLIVPGAVKTNFGKNIIESKNILNGPYEDLYQEWKLRFKSYFKENNTSEEVAKKIYSLIQDPVPEKYVTQKDLIMCYLKKNLPKSWFHWLFLKYYYKHAG